MSYLTIGLLENTSRLVDVSLNWTINSTGWVGFQTFWLLTWWVCWEIRECSAQLCSEGIQITNVHTALLMCWGLIGKWGMCGEGRGRCGNVGEGRGRYGECVGMCRNWGMGSWSTDDDWECRSWGCVDRGNCWRLCWLMEAMLMLLCWYVERLWQICHSVGHLFCGPILSAWKIPPLEDAQSDE